jgi:BON domain
MAENAGRRYRNDPGGRHPADQHGPDRGDRSRRERGTAHDWGGDAVYPESTRWTAGLMSEDLPHAYAGRGPRNYQRSDERVREDVCERLTMDPHVDASGVEVQVRDGEVILGGTVSDRAQKYRAEDLVESIRGVRDISNQIRVRRAGLPGGSERDRGEVEQRDDPALQPGAAARVKI